MIPPAAAPEINAAIERTEQMARARAILRSRTFAPASADLDFIQNEFERLNAERSSLQINIIKLGSLLALYEKQHASFDTLVRLAFRTATIALVVLSINGIAGIATLIVRYWPW